MGLSRAKVTKKKDFSVFRISAPSALSDSDRQRGYGFRSDRSLIIILDSSRVYTESEISSIADDFFKENPGDGVGVDRNQVVSQIREALGMQSQLHA